MSNAPAPQEDKRKLVGPLALVFDLIPTAIFFVFMQHVAYAHTPDWPELWKQVAGAYTSLCMTGVFWLVVQGFRVTLVDQMRRKKAGIPN